MLSRELWLDERGMVPDAQSPQARGTTHEDVPDWWPYAAEFPHWHVWQGVCGVVYARRPRTSPPVVVRGEDAVDLRNQIRRAEGRMTSFKGPNPGPAD
jgi:hypothetical protein